MGRLTFNDDYKEGLKKISEGNPGALRVLMECYQKDFFIGQIVLAQLDIKEVYGWHIWELYKDKCGENLDKFILNVDPDVKKKSDTLRRIGL